MASNYSYCFTKKAMQDFDEIMLYISEELLNPSAAQNLGKKIFNKIDLIRTFPESGALVANDFLIDKTLRKLFADNYIIYYKVIHSKKMISIIRIVYGKRNIDEVLDNI